MCALKYDRTADVLTLSASELSEFAIRRPSVADGGFSASSEPYEIAEEHAVLSFVSEYKEHALLITSDADRIGRRGDSVILEISRTVAHLPQYFSVQYNTEFLAESAVCADVLCCSRSLSGAVLRLTFINRKGTSSVSFERYYDAALLGRMTSALLTRAEYKLNAVIIRATRRIDEISSLSFPYGKPREGQEELMLGTIRTLRRGGRLLASAPTGTGKTMAVLYPAIKALGGGYVDRVFYLTGKGVTGKAALDAMRILAVRAPDLRTVMLRAKERLCRTGGIGEGCRMCPRMCEISENGTVKPYKLRLAEALCELLDGSPVYDASDFAETADRYMLCPHELSLEYSEFCDVIICDYNYAFDSRVRLQRYFLHDRGERYAFLIDEAHNLPDRVRRMYSADFSPSDTDALRTAFGEGRISDPEIGSALGLCDDAFDSISSGCADNSTVVTDRDGDHTVGYLKLNTAPPQLVHAAGTLGRQLAAASHDTELWETTLPLLSALGMFRATTSLANEGSVFLAESLDGALRCRMICLDPSPIIDNVCSAAYATVMFSATLDPEEYFSDVLGCRGTPFIHAESPFPRDHLSVTVFDGISTRLQDRRGTADEIAEVISTVLDAREGNYFVFLPSYDYMKTVCRALLRIRGDIRAVMQKPDMSHIARERFLRVFSEKHDGTTVGFCVLGGIFSEGVDLSGDGLIGVIIVGAGLPGISSELNLIGEYYERKYGNGHLFAYEYPAINRIEQAAGRVIRSADDRGVIVLIDHRMSSPEIVRRFPEFWPPVACTADTSTLSFILKKFWERNA